MNAILARDSGESCVSWRSRPNDDGNKVQLSLSTQWWNVEGIEVYLHSFLTSVLDDGEW